MTDIVTEIHSWSETSPGDIITITHPENEVASIANRWYERNWRVIVSYDNRAMLRGLRLNGTGNIQGNHYLTDASLTYVRAYRIRY